MQFARYSGIDKFYICLKKYYLPYEERLKEVIFYRFEKIKKFKTIRKSSIIFFSKLSNEVINMAPKLDIDFIQKALRFFLIWNLIILIKIQMESGLNWKSYIKSLLDQKYYLTKQQMDFFKKTHFRFFDFNFFCIIKRMSSDKEYSILYDDNFAIHENQIKEDIVRWKDKWNVSTNL